MSSYNLIFEKIKQLIAEVEVVTDEIILENINTYKVALRDYDSTPQAHLRIMLGPNFSDYEPLSEQDWLRLEYEIKSQFYVQFNPGEGIKGEEQSRRNTTWWSDNFSREENYYWDRYIKHLEKEIPGIKTTLNRDTSFVLNNIGDPRGEDDFSIYGMVVGHVQSGKTSHYSGVVAKAADAGYKLIIVIAGDKDNLRNQTQERINETFVGFQDGRPVGVGILNSERERIPFSLTTISEDFGTRVQLIAANFHTEQLSQPNILVIKKNKYILENLKKWLESQGSTIKKVPMLVIDDESDYASINTKEEDDPTAINSLIRGLMSVSNKSAYVAYTATPFANIFIDHDAQNADLGNDLFPRDFIYALDAPDNYFGSAAILEGKSRDIYINEISDTEDLIPLKHKKDDAIHELPKSLLEAIRWFLISVTIRNLRGQTDKDKTMLIHISRFTNKHIEIADLVDDYIGKLRNDFKTYASIQDSWSTKDLKATFEKEYLLKETGEDKEFSWPEVKEELKNTLEKIEIGEAHSKPVRPLTYDEKNPKSVIAIGGVSLSRGFTLKGLTVSYFLRNSMFYDTLMQMARWYGYRIGYQDLCRIYMTYDMADNFTYIHNATVELMSRFKEMVQNGKTPRDFGLAVKQHPDNILKVTALSKMRNTETQVVDLRLEGTMKETLKISAKLDDINHNIKVFQDLHLKLDAFDYSQPQLKGQGHLWKNVNSELILDFLNNVKVFDGDGLGLQSKMPVVFVKEFIVDNHNWDVALFEGRGSEATINNLSFNKNKIQRMRLDEEKEVFSISGHLTSEAHEAINIPMDDYSELSKNRLKARSYPERNNILMLYMIETGDDSIQELPGFGISFSGDSMSDRKHSTYVINTVMLRETVAAMEVEINKE